MSEASKKTIMHLALPFRLELRGTPSRTMVYASPVLAIVLTLIIGALLFIALGKDPLTGLRVFLIDPFSGKRAISELLLKSIPLVLCALGLTVCFRSNIWNIGAEGQLTFGALCAGATLVCIDVPGQTLPGLVGLLLITMIRMLHPARTREPVTLRSLFE